MAAPAPAATADAVKMSRREEVAKEIVSSEVAYVRNLTVMINLFLLPLRSAASGAEAVATADELRVLFSNIELIAGVNHEFLRQLQERYAAWDPPSSCLGNVLLALAPYFKMYKTYCADYDASAQCFQRLAATNPAFVAHLKKIEAIGDARGLDLPSLLIMPIQRIPKYVLLVKRLLEHTPETHPDHRLVAEALVRLEEVAASVNEAIRHGEQMARLVELQRRFLDGSLPFNLVEPARRFVKSGRLSKITSRFVTEAEVLCFNDILIYAYDALGAAVTASASLRFKGRLELGTAWVRDLRDTQYVANGFQLVCPRKTYTLYAASPELKREWLDALNRTIDALVAKDPSLKDKRGVVKLTKRAGFWSAFTVSPQLYDPENRDVRYIEGADDAAARPAAAPAPPSAEGESAPLLGANRTRRRDEDDGGCCGGCALL